MVANGPKFNTFYTRQRDEVSGVLVIRIGAVREQKLDNVKVAQVNGNCQGIDSVDSVTLERLVDF